MPADLEAIVAAARRDGGLPVSAHYLSERVGREDRPFPEEILAGLADDEPIIVGDDWRTRDERGAVCRIVCQSPGGRRLQVRINYEDRPPQVVTAFWLSRNVE